VAPATTSVGKTSQILQMSSSSWSTTVPGPVTQNFNWIAEPAGNNTATPSGALLLQYQPAGSAATNILSIASNGVVTFPSAQTFAGTLNNITADSPLTAARTGGSYLMGINLSALETLLDPLYPQVDASNTFNGNQTIRGDLTVTDNLSGQNSTLTGTSSAVDGFLSNGMISITPTTVATTTFAVDSPLFKLGASAYSSTAAAASAETYAWQTQVTGNNTASPTTNLALMFGAGTTTPAATGLSFASNGVIKFSPSQTFPLGAGGGTISGITTTSPLTGNGTSGSVALGLNTSALETSFNALYAQLSAANTFTGNQSITGNLTATGALTAASSTVSGLVTATGGVQAEGEVKIEPATLATTTAGVNSPILEIDASAYSSTGGDARAQKFAWQTQALDNNTSTPMGTLALLFGSGGGTPSPTGLSVAQNGQITFASGQTFPGTGTGSGTITGITTSSPLTGSGTSGSVALSLDPSALETTLNKVYPSLTGSNSFLGTETFTGFSTGILSTASLAGGTAIFATAGASGGTGVSSTGAAYGVVGNSTGAGGIGVEGAGNYGVEAFGQAYGVYATATSSGSSGLWGQGVQYGVYGNGGQFGLYGYTNSGPGTAGVYGVGSVGVQGGGTTYGVQGGTTASTGIGVFGSSSGSNGVGVQGSGTVGVQGNGAVGVQGSTTTAGGSGVYATSTGSGGYGVYGIGTRFGLYGIANQPTSSAGVYGSGAVGVQGGGTLYGVQGGSSTSGGYGVYGAAPQYGVYGTATAGGNAAGVYGTGPNFGVYGLSSGGSNTVGVYGQGGYGMQAGGTQYGIWSQVQSGSAAIAGTYGIYGGQSASGQHPSVDICYSGCGEMFYIDASVQFQAGVWADTNYDGDDSAYYRPALMATADANIAAVLVNNSNVVPGLFVYNAGSGGGSTGTVIIAQGTKGTCSFTGDGDTSCSGTLKSTVKATTADGPGRVETYAVESTENWFEDAGSAQLVNGVAHVNLEPIFGQTVNTDIEYHVFLTPNDDCKGLYATNKTASGFEVHELGGGRSSIPFEYRIMAKRLGHEKERLARVVSPRANRRVNSASAVLEAPK
jgi:hypothetical protein